MSQWVNFNSWRNLQRPLWMEKSVQRNHWSQNHATFANQYSRKHKNNRFPNRFFKSFLIHWSTIKLNMTWQGPIYAESSLPFCFLMHSMICHHLNAKKQEMSFGNYYHNANANNRIKGKRKQTKNSDVVGEDFYFNIPPPKALSQRTAPLHTSDALAHLWCTLLHYITKWSPQKLC